MYTSYHQGADWLYCSKKFEKDINNALSRQNSSNVSLIFNLLQVITISLAFENICNQCGPVNPALGKFFRNSPKVSLLQNSMTTRNFEWVSGKKTGHLLILLVQKIKNSQHKLLRYFQKIWWYKLFVCFGNLYRVLVPLGVRSRL